MYRPMLSLWRKGTPLYADVQAGKLAMPDEDFMADCYERIEPMVRPYGLTPYENSVTLPCLGRRADIIWYTGETGYT